MDEKKEDFLSNQEDVFKAIYSLGSTKAGGDLHPSWEESSEEA